MLWLCFSHCAQNLLHLFFFQSLPPIWKPATEIQYIRILCLETLCFAPHWLRLQTPILFEDGQTLRNHVLLGGRYFWQGDWPALSPEQQLHIQNEHHPTNWPLEGNLKEQEGEHWRTSEDGSASTTDSRLQRSSYEHDRQPAQQPLNPVHIFIKTLWSI